MIRAAVLVGLLALAACGAKQSSTPAWPKSAGRMEVDPEKDGGESLEPQQAIAISAIERSDDKTPAVDPEAIVVETPAKTPAPGGDTKPEGATKTPLSPGDVQIEVIEVRPEDINLDP